MRPGTLWRVWHQGDRAKRRSFLLIEVVRYLMVFLLSRIDGRCSTDEAVASIDGQFETD